MLQLRVVNRRHIRVGELGQDVIFEVIAVSGYRGFFERVRSLGEPCTANSFEFDTIGLFLGYPHFIVVVGNVPLVEGFLIGLAVDVAEFGATVHSYLYISTFPTAVRPLIDVVSSSCQINPSANSNEYDG